MRELLTDSLFLSLALLALTLAGTVSDIVGRARRSRRERARRAMVEARLKELRGRLWRRGEVCHGLEAAAAVVIARAGRAARIAAAADDHALATVDALEPGREPGGGEPSTIEDLAIAAEERLRLVLAEVRRSLPAAHVADFEDAHEAWSAYRERHVRLCRGLPGDAQDRWPTRHLASEALLAARISDLEDLRDIASLAR